MKIEWMRLLGAAGLAISAVSGIAQPAGPPKPVDPIVVKADSIRWTVARPPFPEGADLAVLSGDPYGESLFTIRLRLLPGTTLAEHWHLRQQQITVIDGEVDLTFADHGAPVQHLAGGSYFLLPALKPHTFSCPVQTTIQVTGFGPYDVQRGSTAKSKATLFVRSVSPAAGAVLREEDEIRIEADYTIDDFRPDMFDATMQFESTTPHRSIGCPRVVTTRTASDALPSPPRPRLTTAAGTLTLTCSAATMLGRNDVARPLRVRVILVQRSGELLSNEIAMSDTFAYK